MTKDLAAHNDKKSRVARLTRFTANAPNNTLNTGVVGKPFTDADSNRRPYKKDKPSYGSMPVIKGKGTGTTKKSTTWPPQPGQLQRPSSRARQADVAQRGASC